MINPKQNYFTIGELSKLTNLSIQTLRYYDKINLFKPIHVDTKTNYRYYAESQLYYIDLIRSLKHIGTPLEEIKRAQTLTSEELLDFIKEQEQIVEEKVKKMKEVQYVLMKTKKQMEDQLSIPVFYEVYQTEEPTKRLLALQSPNLNLLDDDPSSYFSFLNQVLENEGGIVNRSYGCIYPLENYTNPKDIVYQYLCTPLLSDKYIYNLSEDMNVLLMPEGRYICIAFQFDIQMYILQYQKLYNYIKANQLVPKSDVYEFFSPKKYTINEEPTFIVEIKVKV